MMKTYVLASGIAGLALVVSAIYAQSKAPAPAFEVASIRPAELPTPGAFRGGPPQQLRVGLQLDSSRLDWGLASLADMIEYAFRVKNYQVSGPDWMRSSRWNVLARLPEGASQDQAPEMMQALLADRFQLKFHREKREQPVYALEVAKGGAKLESISSSDGASPAPDTAGTQAPGLFPGPFGGGPFGRGPGGPPPDAPDGRGGRGPGPIAMTTTGADGATARISPGNNCALHLELSKLTMQDFAETLTPFLDKPVIDATELKGRYKATLDLPMDVMLTMMQNMMRANGLPGPGAGGFGRGPGDGGPDGRGPGDGGPGGRGFAGCDPGAAFANGGADSSNAPIFQAVQKLGLRLQARKAPFDTIIVDHLEKTPSEN